MSKVFFDTSERDTDIIFQTLSLNSLRLFQGATIEKLSYRRCPGCYDIHIILSSEIYAESQIVLQTMQIGDEPRQSNTRITLIRPHADEILQRKLLTELVKGLPDRKSLAKKSVFDNL